MGLLGCTAVTSGTSGRSGCVGMDEAESCCRCRALGSPKEGMEQKNRAVPPKIPSSKLEFFFPPVASIKHYRKDFCLYFGEAAEFSFSRSICFMGVEK